MWLGLSGYYTVETFADVRVQCRSPRLVHTMRCAAIEAPMPLLHVCRQHHLAAVTERVGAH